MIIFIVSGYAWWNRIIIPLQLDRYMHTQLDTYLFFFFLMHTLISTKFTLARWRVGSWLDGQCAAYNNWSGIFRGNPRN